MGELCGPDKDTHFFVGTILAYQKTWVVIGVFYPKIQPEKRKAGAGPCSFRYGGEPLSLEYANPVPRSLRGRRTGIGRIEIEDRTCHEPTDHIFRNRTCCCRRR